MTLDSCKDSEIDKSALSKLEENIADFKCVNGLPLSITDLKKVTVSFSPCEGTNQPFLCRSKAEILQWRANTEIVVLARAQAFDPEGVPKVIHPYKRVTTALKYIKDKHS